MALLKRAFGVSGLISRNVRDGQWTQRMGKKKKLDLTRLEGEEAKYFNPTLIDGVNEPEYLKLLKPPTPYHDLLNLKLECPDFAILEKFTSYLVRRSRVLGVNVYKYWPLQHKELQYDVLKDEETVIDHTFTIKIYRRVLQLKDLQATLLPIFIQLIDASKPPGLDYSIAAHTKDDEKARYVIDTNLMALKEELAEIKADLDFSGSGKK